MLITAGSKIGVYYALQTILNDGDEVLLLEPFWVSYTEQVKLVGAIPKSVPNNVNVHDLENFVTSKTRVLILNNPQNPTGKNYSRKELEHIFEVAKRFDIAIISDEAYSDFVCDDDVFISMGSIDPAFERTVIVNSISKNFGISGWRIGYLISNMEIVDVALKLTQHTMTCAPTPLLMYLDRYFEDIIQVTKPQIDLLLRKRSRVLNSITDVGLRVELGNSTFYFFVDIRPSGLDSIAFCDRLLQEYKVVAVPGIGYGASCDHFVRISIGSETEERINHGLQQIRRLIEVTQ
jgi:aspartate aminotransferase/aminotransferase